MSARLAPRGSSATAARELVDWSLWRRWTLFTALGELLGFAAPAVVMAAGTVGRWSDTAQTVAAMLAGAVEGAVLGLVQWLALRHALPSLSRRAWVLATALGAMVAYLLAMLAVGLGPIVQQQVALLATGAVVVGVGFLVSIGVPQWLVLRHQIRHAGWWVPVNAIAWPLGVVVPFIALALVPNAAPFWVWAVTGIVSGVFMGLVVGAITGLGLVWLLHSEASAGSVPSVGRDGPRAADRWRRRIKR
jgi:hypothetical protein